ncbi:helix-turn-helix domain-containing protein [Paenibacillus sp. KQZ6P-2]|uniref:Helix-turn-helix domain-containing protein n=1 Tax=Paenibacillus mangrovi TaxID=2931978 RepID=A0A9X1WPX4_9BACL|nr:helix-turn-helix domain-containing protein [Paenibacillus mangrovi]MCJ8011533.1 helix-turn-helix domain-containing protein [Paenibacillus mangrovi]
MRKVAGFFCNHKWSNRFYHYLFSYIILVVSILIIVSGVVYQSFITTLSNEIEASTFSTMSKIKDEMDTRLGEMNRMAMQIASDPSLTPFRVSENGYSSYKTVQELKKYKSTNLFIRDIVLYYTCPTCTSMYSASGTYDSDIFFQYIYHYRDWSFERFASELPNMNFPGMRPLEPVKINGKPVNMSTYLYPISTNSAKPYGAVMFLIDEKTVNQLIQNVLGNNRGFVFINNGRDIIAHHSSGESEQNAEFVKQWVASEPAAVPVSEVKIQRRHYTVINVKSEFNGWSYITVIPSELVMNKVDQSRKLFSWTIIAVFVLGILMAVIFAERNYRPFRKLIASISSGKRVPSLTVSRTADEIDIISDYVSEMNKECDGLLSKLQSQASIVKEQSLLKIVKGSAKETEQQETMTAISSLQLDRSHFVVLLFIIDNYNQFIREYTQSMQGILKYSLIKMTEESASELGNGYGVELTDNRGIVMLLNMNEEAAKLDRISGLVDKVKRVFSQDFHLTLTVGVGDICTNISMIPQSFFQANQATRYRFIRGQNQIICHRELQNAKKHENWYPLELETQMLKAIKQGNSGEVQKLIKETMDNIAIRQMSLEAVEFVCFDIVNTMMKALMELNIETEKGIEQMVEELYIPRFETMEELESFIVDFCCKVCDHIVLQKESKNFVLLANIQAYINDNFKDNTLDLNRIAETFEISASYTTRFFKDHTSYSIMRYIDQLRMDVAKQMIATTELTLKEIMSESGYNDANNFIRKFKKAEGVTPMEYRKIIQGSPHVLEANIVM